MTWRVCQYVCNIPMQTNRTNPCERRKAVRSPLSSPSAVCSYISHFKFQIQRQKRGEKGGNIAGVPSEVKSKHVIFASHYRQYPLVERFINQFGGGIF